MPIAIIIIIIKHWPFLIEQYYFETLLQSRKLLNRILRYFILRSSFKCDYLIVINNDNNIIPIVMFDINSLSYSNIL